MKTFVIWTEFDRKFAWSNFIITLIFPMSFLLALFIVTIGRIPFFPYFILVVFLIGTIGTFWNARVFLVSTPYEVIIDDDKTIEFRGHRWSTTVSPEEIISVDIPWYHSFLPRFGYSLFFPRRIQTARGNIYLYPPYRLLTSIAEFIDVLTELNPNITLSKKVKQTQHHVLLRRKPQ